MNVRPAQLADVAAMAALHLRAFAGEMGAVVGEGYVRALLRWFITTPGAVALVAEDAGAIVGYVFGAADGYGPRLTRDLMGPIARGVLRHLPAVMQHPSFRRQVRARLVNMVLRREPQSVFTRSMPRGAFCLVGIGTAAASRGRGVGRALIDAFTLQARTRGAACVVLDVFRDNAAARALYDKAGFRVLVEEGRVVRMRMDVSA